MRPSPDENGPTPDAPRRSRVRFELIFASLWLAFGLFVLPGVIYAVGLTALGPYGENQGVGAFYANFFRDLAEPSGRTWAISLGPLVLVGVLRAIFLGLKAPPSKDNDATHQPAPPKPTQESHRVEPRVSLD